MCFAFMLKSKLILVNIVFCMEENTEIIIVAGISPALVNQHSRPTNVVNS